MQFDIEMFLGILIVPGAVLAAVFLFKWLMVSNPEGHEVLRLRFGKLDKRTTDPGLIGSTRLLPYDRFITVSRQWDERIFRAIESNDSQGTLVQVDLRVTFRIVDSDRALFAVNDWEEALESSTVHEAAAELSGKDRAQFLSSAAVLSDALAKSVRETMAVYGIEIREVRMMNVEFRPEVTRQMFEAVAARLEVAKAECEERGRTDAALLLARTEQQVAELEARAKTESLKAVGRAYHVLRQRPQVFEAYADLYRLAQLDPTKIVSFDGFVGGAMSATALVEADLELDKDAGHRAARRSMPTNTSGHA